MSRTIVIPITLTRNEIIQELNVTVEVTRENIGNVSGSPDTWTPAESPEWDVKYAEDAKTCQQVSLSNLNDDAWIDISEAVEEKLEEWEGE